MHDQSDPLHDDRRDAPPAADATSGDAGDRSEDAEVSVTEGVIVFWRPGCGFCSSLMYQLEATGLPLYEVNIWEDPQAAATVRSIANGNETVPCVVVGEVAMVNPSLDQVLTAVSEQAPHLLPSAPT